VLAGGGMGMHDLAWMRQNAPEDGSVSVRDVSSQYSAVGLWGPMARQVLEKEERRPVRPMEIVQAEEEAARLGGGGNPEEEI